MNDLEYGTNDINGYTVIIEHDTDYESPRDWSNLGTMVCWHDRSYLGDEQRDRHSDDIQTEVNDLAKAGAVILPLFLYEHSGMTMNTSGFECPWDSGQVGFIYVTAERIRQEYSVKRISKQIRAKVIACLISEVKTYDQCLTGDVYGYVIENPSGDNVDSCYGFYGDEFVKEQAWEALQGIIAQDKLNRIDQVKTWIRNHVPLANRQFCL